MQRGTRERVRLLALGAGVLTVGAGIAALNWLHTWRAFRDLDATARAGRPSAVTVASQGMVRQWIAVALVALVALVVAGGSALVARRRTTDA